MITDSFLPRPAKMPEVVVIARATGCAVARFSGSATVADRVQCATRVAGDCDLAEMRTALLRFMELNDYLDGQAVPEVT